MTAPSPEQEPTTPPIAENQATTPPNQELAGVNTGEQTAASTTEGENGVEMSNVVPPAPDTNSQVERAENAESEQALEIVHQLTLTMQERLKQRQFERLSAFIEYIGKTKVRYKEMPDATDSQDASWDPAHRVASYQKGEGVELYKKYLENPNKDIIFSHEMGHAIIEEINPQLTESLYNLFEQTSNNSILEAIPQRIREMIKRMQAIDENAPNFQEELDYYRNEVAAELTAIWLDAQAKESGSTDILAVYMKRLSADTDDINKFNEKYRLNGNAEEDLALIQETPFAKMLVQMGELFSSELTDDKIDLEAIKSRSENIQPTITSTRINEEGYGFSDYGHQFGSDLGANGREAPYQGAGSATGGNPVWNGFIALL